MNLACAVVHRPALLLLDEPTAGVDAQSKNHLFEAIDELKSLTGVTVVYSTHQTEEATRLCDRVAVIDRGRVLTIREPIRSPRAICVCRSLDAGPIAHRKGA